MSKNIMEYIPYKSRVKAFNAIVDIVHTATYGDEKGAAYERKASLRDKKNESLRLLAEIEKSKTARAQAKAAEAEAKAYKKGGISSWAITKLKNL